MWVSQDMLLHSYQLTQQQGGLFWRLEQLTQQEEECSGDSNTYNKLVHFDLTTKNSKVMQCCKNCFAKKYVVGIFESY